MSCMTMATHALAALQTAGSMLTHSARHCRETAWQGWLSVRQDIEATPKDDLQDLWR